MTSRCPNRRETAFRSQHDELTTWQQFLNDGIITQEQYDELPGHFQPLEDEGDRDDDDEEDHADD